MTTPIIVTGDDMRQPVQLTINSLPFAIGLAGTVKARLVTLDHKTALTVVVDQSRSAAGADWSASLVVVEMPPTATAPIAEYGPSLLEVQVDDVIKETWFIPVTIVQGHID
jgi:CheY-specific phosphatase CheX